mmetsp:Transcript_9993/g.19725  ORF Transcript_9993/g.19725 Transcript_9993/m.19725 type:complete len:86 (-) Transcript_9993:231-488(-)
MHACMYGPPCMYKCMGAHPNTNTIAYQHRVLMENVFSDSIESDGEGVEESRADSIGHEAPDESLETLGLGIETLPTEFPPEDNTV